MFDKAKPIWLINKRSTPNLQVGFRCNFFADSSKKYVLRLTGATLYKIFLNGKFIGYGPARAGHGYMRCDEIVLDVLNGKNKLAIEVAGYNCSSYYSLPIKSFLCAEILENEKAVFFTGKDFYALSLENLRNIYSCRYSAQRTYSEIWNFDLSDSVFHWKVSDKISFEETDCYEITETFINRLLPLPLYNIVSTEDICESGNIIHKNVDKLSDVRYITNVSNHYNGYLKEEITELPINELFGDFVATNKLLDSDENIRLKSNEYAIFELNENNTGFLINSINAIKDSNVYVFFSEHNYGNGMIFDALSGQTNVIKYNLKCNTENYNLESFEVYTCKYIGVAVTEGEIMVDLPKMREYSYPQYNNAEFTSSDEDLNCIFNAALNTFRQNTVDVFMDCPGRERGGWLCDSYFTAQSEKMFTGKSLIEKAFLDNFIMAKEFPNIPQGMIPMVYPSDVKRYNAGYIPQWAMWFVIELGEYAEFRDKVDVEKYKTLCYNLLEWFEKYENENGLLEKLPGWNFVEWSKANDWVQDVNYPTNMLYCKFLYVMGKLFKNNNLTEKSTELKKEIIKQSFDGELFVDNAVRNFYGQLELTGNHSETCQYYAYFTGIAEPENTRFRKLTNILFNVFGPDRKRTNELPNIPFSNAFIGNYLRLIILLKNKKFDKAISDIKGYFTNMSKITGTLWEFDDLERAKTGGSLNHGFASYAGVAIIMACAGIKCIDYNKKTIDIDSKSLIRIDYELNIGTPEGKINISECNGIKTVKMPYGWSDLNT